MKLHEVAIFTDRIDDVATFYERLLGVPPVHRGEGIAIFSTGQATVLVHRRYEPQPGDPPCESHTAFAVADLDGAVAKLEQQGLTIEIPPREFDWGRSAYLRDPEGRLLELHEADE